MKNKVMNFGKGNFLKNKYPEFKNAQVINIGNEECLLINWNEKQAEKFSKTHQKLNGHFSKTGFVACNLHNL